jgi:hypothetical protein
MPELNAAPELLDWRERQYVSQYSQPPLQFSVYIAGQPADPDDEAVSAQLFLQNQDGTTTPVNTYTAAREQQGVYQVVPSSSDTSTPADAMLAWYYQVSGNSEQYVSYLVIGQANPAYDSLPQNIQDLIELVFIRFADCFDSPSGGPNLQAYFQAHWSRGRVAQLMQVSLMNLNTIAQPWSNYTLDGSGGAPFPVSLWGGVLGTATYIECVKHLMRGYAEQPVLQGGGAVTRQDRRDYLQRWQQILKEEQESYQHQLDMFKIRHLGLGNPRVLVSGGVYGRYAPTRVAGSVAARPRMWARWY